MTRTKDLLGNKISGTNLVKLMDIFQEFLNKITCLQEVLGRLGVTVHCSPKYHDELAGEIIEYSWGFSKNFYCCFPICKKRKKETFRESVSKVLSRKHCQKRVR